MTPEEQLQRLKESRDFRISQIEKRYRREASALLALCVQRKREHGKRIESGNPETRSWRLGRRDRHGSEPVENEA